MEIRQGQIGHKKVTQHSTHYAQQSIGTLEFQNLVWKCYLFRRPKHTFPNSKYVVLVNRNLFAGKWKIGGRAFQSSTVLISPVQTFTNPFLYSSRCVLYPSSSVWLPRKEKEGREGRKRRNFFNLSLCFVVQACLDSGFFYVINHGISQEFMDEVFAQSKRFFTLPLSEKMKHLRNEKHRGYTPVLDEVLDPENQVNGWLFASFFFFMRYSNFHMLFNCWSASLVDSSECQWMALKVALFWMHELLFEDTVTSFFYFFGYFFDLKIREWYKLFCYLVVGDYKEGYYIGVEVPEHDPKSEKPFYGPNVWPAAGNFLNNLKFCFRKFGLGGGVFRLIYS